jgi:AraC-like DNA-binding protein
MKRTFPHHMNLIDCFSHKGLQWKPEFPPVYKAFRIPGSEAFTSTGNFGCVSVQQFQGEGFRIRLYLLELSETFVFKSLMPCTQLQSLVSLGGKWKLQSSQEKSGYLEKHKLILPGHIPGLLTISAYHKRGLLFELCFSPQLLDEMQDSFPLATQHLYSSPHFSFATKTINIEIISLIHAINHCQYESSKRLLYFKSKVRSLLFEFMVLMEMGAPDSSREENQNDKELVAEIERMITSDLSQQYSLDDLAKKILTSKTRIKRAFKAIKGVPPFEFLVIQRMQHAYNMLANGSTPKQAAMATGYQPSAFNKAFYKKFGKHPSEMRTT